MVLDQGISLETLAHVSAHDALQPGRAADGAGSKEKPIPLRVEYVLWSKSKHKVSCQQGLSARASSGIFWNSLLLQRDLVGWLGSAYAPTSLTRADPAAGLAPAGADCGGQPQERRAGLALPQSL